MAVRMPTEDQKTKAKDILAKHLMPDAEIEAAITELYDAWMAVAAEGDMADGERKELALSLGCREDASPKDLVEGAKTLRALYDATSKRAIEQETRSEEDVFAMNEKKGLHRHLEQAGKGMAKRLFASNRALYDAEVAKVKPLTQASPEAPQNLRKLSVVEDTATQFASEVRQEQDRAKVDYTTAYDIVAARWQKEGKNAAQAQ